jgi:hypothetical protein
MTMDTWMIEYQGFTVQAGLLCMILSGSMMILFGLYLEMIMPKTYGQRKSLCFCFTENYGRRITNNQVVTTGNEIEADFETAYLDKDCYEPPARAMIAKE